jgi:glutathione S-transferase
LVAVKLYVIPGSSPSKAAELMLDRKGIDYKRVDLVMAMHRPTLRMMGFPGKTVPALKADGRKVQGTRQISRFLDELTPGDRLVSSDAVAEAERWDDEQLQPVLRRLLFWALLLLPGKERTRISRRSLEGYRIGMPIGIASRTGLPLIKMAAGYTESTDENARAALAGLPEKIDRVDALLAEGVIGGEQLNAADFEVGCTVRGLLEFEDLKPYVESRPAAAHARRVRPHLDLGVPKVFPPEWLPSRPAA